VVTLARRTTGGLVAAESREAADAGVALLTAGGNAIDAAVAAALAETVVAPHNAGIGGFAGQMLVYLADRAETVAIRFDSVAPAAARADMFVGKREQHRAGAMSVGVPGVLRGLETAVLRFGRRPWRAVVAPALALAEDGFVLSVGSAGVIQGSQRLLSEHPETAAMLMPDGVPPAPGNRLRFPELARSLRRIGDEGADVFYRGELGAITVRHLREHGGTLGLEDLAAYEAVVDAPLAIRIGPHRFVTPALPGGGITVLQALQVLHHLPAPTAARPEDDPVYLHHRIQAMKLVWRDRLTHMADPAGMERAPEAFLADAYARELAGQILAGRVPEDFQVPADFTCTSHVTTADREGNLAALTYTHGFAYGSLVTPPGTGIILGHGMARFDGEPGRPNSVAPGKRPLHNMAPLVIMRDDGPYAILGWTGGRRIPNVVLHVVEGLCRFGLSPEDAMASPNLHTEGAEPTRMERGPSEATLDALRRQGHCIEFQDSVVGFGSLIVRDGASGRYNALTDPRRDGVVADV